VTTFLGKAIRNTVLLCTFGGCMLFVAQQAMAAVEVFVSIPPQKWLSDRIGGEHITTGVLIQKGQDPHTFEPTPRQVMALTRAQLYFTVGMEFENQIVEKLRQSSMEQKIVDSTAGIQRIALVQHDHDHDHNHPGLDPHVWLSPANLKTMAAAMTSALIGIDPENSSAYKVNLDKLTRELDALDREIASQLQTYAGATFFVFHPSFGYFARRYNLQQEAVEVEGKSPTPKQLANLIAEAKADKVKVIFVQPQFDPRSGQAIARAIGGEVVPLDALAEDVTGNLKTIAAKISAALAR